MPDKLPDDIVQAIAISNAKAIGEQPAILANLALSNQILNNNLQQQMALSQMQAMNQISMATVAKCIALITDSKDDDPKEMNTVQKMMEIIKQMGPPGTATPIEPVHKE